MNGDNGTSAPHSPQLRALLFTDLCDSLQLVERIGDVAAASLFQEHDRLVLVLQQRWNGQLIDRSDGLFMLFERVVDALGFALDYQRELHALGQQRAIELRARAGLHVGDVLTWENSAEAVRAGAKSMEVEGLAKPMAALSSSTSPQAAIRGSFLPVRRENSRPVSPSSPVLVVMLIAWPSESCRLAKRGKCESSFPALPPMGWFQQHGRRAAE